MSRRIFPQDMTDGSHKKVRVSLSLSRELVEEIDTLRGLIPRSAIVEALLKITLRRVRRPHQTHTPHPSGEASRSKEEDDSYDEYWNERPILTDPLNAEGMEEETRNEELQYGDDEA